MPGGTSTPWEVIIGWPPRSDNPIRRGWGLTIFTVLAYSLTVSVVALRIWARHVIQRNAGIDDLVILVAVIPLSALAICIAGAGRWWYFDRHVWDLTPEQGVFSRKMAMAIELLYLYSTSLVKISILLFYRRMVRGSYSPAFLRAVKGCIAFVICYATAFTFTLFLGCRPLSAFWNKVNTAWVLTHQEGKDWECFNEAASLLAATAFSVLQDFIACLMPTIIFWKLSLPIRQKFALSVVFGIGIFTCVAGVVRLYYIYKIFYVTYDTTWIAYTTWFWTSVEIHLGVICASLPALKTYFQTNVKPAQMRVDLDSGRGDDTLHTRTRNKSKATANSILSSRLRRTNQQDDSEEHEVEHAAVGRDAVSTHHEKRQAIDEVWEVSATPLSSPKLARNSTSGSRRPLRLHDPTEDQRPGSYAASATFNDERQLEVHRIDGDRPCGRTPAETLGVMRPQSLPSIDSLGGQHPAFRKGSTVEKRNSAGY